MRRIFPGSASSPRGLRAYLSVLRSPDVAVPAAGTALASLPIGMLGLAMLLLVRQRSGDFASAGAVVAALGVGTVVGMIVQGRLIDRWGPRGVLLAGSTVRAASSIVFVIVTDAQPPLWVLAALAAVVGASEPQVISVLRSLWPVLVVPTLRPAATALSSVLFELPVLAGPLVLAVVLAACPVEVALLGAAGFAVVGAWMVAWSAAAGRWPRGPVPHRRSPLAVPQIRLIIVVVAVQGLAVGMLQVKSAAAAGTPERAGLLYASLTAGSLLGTTLYGARTRPVVSRWHLPGLLAGSATLLACAARVDGSVSLGGCLFAFGVVAGPVAVRCFMELARHTPPGSPAAATTVLIAAGLAVTSAGSGLAGWAVDAGAAPAVLLSGGVCVAAAAGWTLVTDRPC